MVKAKPTLGSLSRTFKPTGTDLRDAPVRALKMLSVLYKTYPEAKCALNYRNALELLVATILSAQCTDVRVNLVTRGLFKKYRNAGDFADGPVGELEEVIQSTGFFRNKAKNIKGACGDIVSKFGGKVPGNLEDLVSLAGVGRKTANVVLGNSFDVPGVVTDTHVIRLSRLMGLSKNSDPVKLEYDLMELFDRKDWTMFSHMMIFHGRRICRAGKPDCANCPMSDCCSFGLKHCK